MRVFWFDSSFAKGDLLDRTLGTSTTWNGHASGTVEVTQAGSCGLVVARDPSAGTGPDTLTIQVEPALANLRPILLSHWYSPLVPRPVGDGTISLVAEPDTLIGNQPQTWFNLAAINQTPAGIPVAVRQLRIDGAAAADPRDGRDRAQHHLRRQPGRSQHRDAADGTPCPWSAIPATSSRRPSETDNTWAEQFVWSPLELAFGSTGLPAGTAGSDGRLAGPARRLGPLLQLRRSCACRPAAGSSPAWP